MGGDERLEVEAPIDAEDEAERLLAAGILDALHNGLPPAVWAEMRRQRAQRLAPLKIARQGDSA